jgi:hypothetical protein
VTATLDEPGSRLATAIVDRWTRFWFDPIPAVRVGLLRIWLFGFVAADVALRKEVSVAMADVPRLFWHPVGATWLLDEVGIGPPDAWVIRAVQVALVLVAVAAMAGVAYRVTGPVVAVLYLYWQSLGQSFGEMKHARVTLVLALFFLCLVAADQRRSVGALRHRLRRAEGDLVVEGRPDQLEASRDGAWAVRAIQVGLAVLYFLSGYSKLRSVGIDWIWGDTLRQAIQDKASSGETTSLGFHVLRHPWMLVTFQAVSLLWELAFPLVFFRRFRFWVLTVGVLFNVGLWTTVRIEFFGVVACFVAFLPLERWEQHVRAWVARRRTSGPVELSYDGRCPRCIRQVSLAVALDWRHVLVPVDRRRFQPAASTRLERDDGPTGTVPAGHHVPHLGALPARTTATRDPAATDRAT